MKYITAGESHGKAIMGILEGVPSNLKLDISKINAELKRRQQGHGRGGRMLIETDEVEIIAGVRGGVTTGAPIGFMVYNKDYKNWSDIIGAEATKTNEKMLTALRPGHADLGGCVKYGHTDARNVLERASARETTAKVVIGAICKQFLECIGVKVASYTLSIGGIEADKKEYSIDDIIAKADASKVRVMDAKAEKNIIELIDTAMKNRDTLGGKLRVMASGMVVGVGSHIAPDKRLEFNLMSHLGAIGSVKSVSIGQIDNKLESTGSQFHDSLHYDKNNKIVRKTNNAGGIEGGISNGEIIDITLTLKPIPSVPMGVDSVDIATKKPSKSAIERGDACVVPPAGVVAESVLAYALSQSIMDTISGDTMAEVIERVKAKKEATL